MNSIDQIERITQHRVVKLLSQQLGYDYLGDWQDRENNRNIETQYLSAFLQQQGHSQALINKAIYEFEKTASDQTLSLFYRNKAVYQLLRYGLKIKADIGENTQTVWLIDWKNHHNNHFAFAQEVTIKGANAKANNKRPDIVLYVNGIALGVIELKRSTVSVSEGIRQNLDNQKPQFIEPFFSTQQLVMAGNDSQGIRYGTTLTAEKYYLTWKEPFANNSLSLLDVHLCQLCEKTRFLELIHDFVVFDFGTKKLCRPNQYFGIKAAQAYIKRREGGIIWHTQGSGKSLTMVWLTKWIRENIPDARVLLITDRTELDEQIEKVFMGVNETIYRTKSGADLIAQLNVTTEWLLCSLIHKFGNKEEGDIQHYVHEVKKSLPLNFKAKGDIYVFVDECHRTQSGALHEAMKSILPHAVFIGFTGTPLLKADKQKSIEIFGRYIHTYKFNEAVKDGVVLDLRYEARDIDQYLTSPKKIDEWFESNTKDLTDIAKAQLKARWGTLQKVLSSKDRLQMIVNDIMMDMAKKPRLMDGRGNAMLVSSSIYQACKFYELFQQTPLQGKCAIVTSYKPTTTDIKGEETGHGLTEKLHQYDIYQKMLNGKDANKFEMDVKKQFIDEPAQMKLLIVVDKLLTGFDAPSATYLYIDKQMRDHGLFQAICRVNRLHGEDKEYGYIVDYKDLFKSLESTFKDYTSGALDAFDAEDVAGLLSDRLDKAKERLEEAREGIKALCEPVALPRSTNDYLHYFCATDSGNVEQLKNNAPKRLMLYKMTAALIRAFANLSGEMEKAGYSPNDIHSIKQEVEHYDNVRTAIKLQSADYIDLKVYEPAMRFLIDTYIRAGESEKISAFDEVSLVQLMVQKGSQALDSLPDNLRTNPEAVAETIENNVRKLIIDEQPINPKYYEQMSDLLDKLIEQRKQEAIEYQAYLAQIIELAKQAVQPNTTSYPQSLNSAAQRALYDNLSHNEALAIAVHNTVMQTKKDDWRNNTGKTKEVRRAIKEVLPDKTLLDTVFSLVQNQHEY
ncbi:MAG TPA: HsdR family type I site-specific deoxyribonuclease [Agitococcus sp.]|nr:HsdR family type I site-specific deoxyribonuclease [Agitococcus sp.]